MEEQELVKRLQRADREAQRALYECHAGRLMALCMRYAGRRDVAEDMLHDLFLKIFSSIDRFSWRGEGSLWAWMKRVAINHAIARLREEHRLSRFIAEEHFEVSDEELTADDLHVLPDSVLIRLIGELPDGYRTILNLYCIEGLTHEEIATLLGIHANSSSSQLSRARKMLATAIRTYLKQRV